MRSLARLLLVGVGGLAIGCGGGSSGSVTSAIAVTLSTAPTVTLQTGGKLTITASIANDTTGAGLAWSIVPVTGCGSYLVVSDTTVVYSAPTSLAASCTATVKATSFADDSKSASVEITVP
jgi:hypothetical protein